MSLEPLYVFSLNSKTVHNVIFRYNGIDATINELIGMMRSALQYGDVGYIDYKGVFILVDGYGRAYIKGNVPEATPLPEEINRLIDVYSSLIEDSVERVRRIFTLEDVRKRAIVNLETKAIKSPQLNSIMNKIDKLLIERDSLADFVLQTDHEQKRSDARERLFRVIEELTKEYGKIDEL